MAIAVAVETEQSGQATVEREPNGDQSPVMIDDEQQVTNAVHVSVISNINQRKTCNRTKPGKGL